MLASLTIGRNVWCVGTHGLSPRARYGDRPGCWQRHVGLARHWNSPAEVGTSPPWGCNALHPRALCNDRPGLLESAAWASPNIGFTGGGRKRHTRRAQRLAPARSMQWPAMLLESAAWASPNIGPPAAAGTSPRRGAIRCARVPGTATAPGRRVGLLQSRS